jgi:hypothetical protein
MIGPPFRGDRSRRRRKGGRDCGHRISDTATASLVLYGGGSTGVASTSCRTWRHQGRIRLADGSLTGDRHQRFASVQRVGPGGSQLLDQEHRHLWRAANAAPVSVVITGIVTSKAICKLNDADARFAAQHFDLPDIHRFGGDAGDGKSKNVHDVRAPPVRVFPGRFPP